MFAPCYIAMLEQFDTYMQTPLEPLADGQESRYGHFDYPIAMWCEEAEVHFVHAKSIGEAIDTFHRRRQRFLEARNSNHPILVKFDDRDHFTPDLAFRFQGLPSTSFDYKLLILSQRNRQLIPDLPSPRGVLLLDDDVTPDGRVLEFGVGVAKVLPLAALRSHEPKGISSKDASYIHALTDVMHVE